MIEDKDRKIIIEMAKRFGVKRVVLFGSSLCSDRESHDIDIGVEGILEKDFFTFYGELMFALSKPIDIVDLSIKNRFVELIEQEGIPLYA
ncbi:MAG: hypothetical protein ILNGONEN_02534 [Syntrophorhabdaceae bacterium]|nr:hypothetical protein [Syntrophorhabdaceae bacterium]